MEEALGKLTAPGVAPADERHLHYLPVHELYPVVLGKQAGLPHPVVLLYGEAAPLDLGR